MDPKMLQSLELHLLSPFSTFVPAVFDFLFFCFFVFVFVCLCLRQKQFWVRVFDCGITIPSLHWMTCISTGGGLYDFPLSTGEDFTKIPPFESWESLTSKVFCTFYKVPHLPPTEVAYFHSFCWPSGLFSSLPQKPLPTPDHDSLLPSPYPLTPRSCLCLLNAEIKGVVKHNQLSPLFVLYKCLLLHSVFSTECMKAVCEFVNVWTHKSRRVWKRLHWMFWK